MKNGFFKSIGYDFSDYGLFRQAMMHSSYANEHGGDRRLCNERPEFLGDAVLELVSSEYIFRHYPDMNEGDMTKLRASIVCEPALYDVAEKIGLPGEILLGKGEEAAGGRHRPSLVSDALEALIGAIYLDGGFEPATAFVKRFIMEDHEKRKLFKDSKTILQEKAQTGGFGEPVYELVSASGPEHMRVFTVSVAVGGKVMGTAEGKSKKAAEQAAAGIALKNME